MSRVRAAGQNDDALRWSLAGPDMDLAASLEELAAGNFIAASDLLKRDHSAGPASDLRCYRLMLMAQSAAPSGAAERWVAERPRERDAWALLARVAVLQAVRAHKHGEPRARDLTAQAWRVCEEAAGEVREDPVPWVARLQLAAAIPVGKNPASGKLEFENPYPLLDEVRQRHRLSREGHFRLLAAVGPEAGGTMGQVIEAMQYVMQYVPEGSVLHLLPVLMHLTSFRTNAAAGTRARLFAADREWSTYAAKFAIEGAYGRWFASSRRHPEVLLPDLHLLAHALWRADSFDAASEVFREIGPWAVAVPWNEHGDAERILQRARDRCLSPPG
ncbi:hypothetical protein ABH935_007086 [Catenulispora sp. GAS73]|uniref:hypothetical protein n=1 Tax=Catenulispora sp. GAS73 TaxID=3156269 RepID=UPI003518FA84